MKCDCERGWFTAKQRKYRKTPRASLRGAEKALKKIVQSKIAL
jgi:hypothetical protein